MTRLGPRFEMALSFAASLHREQSRKASNIPYVAHLLAVASIVLEHGGGEDEAIAALLHDAIEDQGGHATGERIRSRFGDVVAEIVVGCSEAQVTPRPAWPERKESHLAHVAVASPAVKLVVAADKLHNCRSLAGEYRRQGEPLWSHFRGGKAGTLWYYRAALAAVADKIPTALAIELELAVAELEKLASA